jgi:hypothetical protein
MAGDDHDGAIGEGLQKPSACRPGSLRIDAEAAVELRVGALERCMHDVAAQDHGALR